MGLRCDVTLPKMNEDEILTVTGRIPRFSKIFLLDEKEWKSVAVGISGKKLTLHFLKCKMISGNVKYM